MNIMNRKEIKKIKNNIIMKKEICLIQESKEK